MARADRPTGLTPERQLARRFVERFDLRMPIDIRDLVAEHADLNELKFPGSVRCDAVVILNSDPPKLFLNNARPLKRQRFTLAHELGHLVLPWHAGATVCEPIDRLSTPGNSGSEGEANAFASEILVPRRDLDEVTGEDAPTERLELAAPAGVSDAARLRAVADSLDPGYALVLCDAGGKVLATSVSPGTHTPTPYPGETFDRKRFRRDSDRYEMIRVGTRRIHWWFLGPPSRGHRQPGARAADLLDQILGDMARIEGPAAAERARRSLAGILGAAFGRSTSTEADDLVSIFRQRFVARDHLTFVVNHGLFGAYLWGRAEELAERNRQRRQTGA